VSEPPPPTSGSVTGPTSSGVVGGRIAVRPVLGRDLDWLESLDLAADAEVDWRYEGAVPPPEVRRRRLWEGVIDQRVFVRVADGRPLGYGTLYEHNRRASSAWFAVAIDGQFQRTPWSFGAVGLYVTTCFREWPLRRLLAETKDESFQGFASAVEAGAVHLAGHFPRRAQRPDGRSVDVRWLDIRREAWFDTYGRWFTEELYAAGRD
jgi:hypothetical protein